MRRRAVHERKVREARSEDGRLHLVESRVETWFEMVVAVRLSAVPQPAQPGRERAVAGHDRAAVAKGTEVLRRIEAERAGHADGAHGSAAGCCQVRLTRIFDQRQFVPRGHLLQGVHIRGLSVQMHRQNRPCARRDGAFGCGRVERQTFRIDVGEDWTRTDHHDRQRGVRGRQWRRDDLVARSNAQRAQDQRDCVGSISHADRVADATRGGELGFKRRDFRAEHVPPAADHTLDCRAHRGGVFARRGRTEWNAESAHDGSCGSTAMYCSRCER